MHFTLCKPNLLDFDYVTQYAASFIVSIGVLLEGMHYAWSSTAIPKILEQDSLYDITFEETAYIIEMFTYGSIAYDIVSLSCTEINQKSGVIFSIMLMIISWILIASSKASITLMIARFVAGIARSVAYQFSINYICEIADPKIRGFLGSFVFIMTNMGEFIVYAMGPYVEIYYSSILGILIAIGELVVIKWVAESHYALLLRGKTQEARKVLRSLRCLWNVENELDKTSDIVKKQDDENSSFWSIFTVRSNLKALFIVCSLYAFQALIGVNIVIRDIMKLSGGNDISYRIAAITQISCVILCIISACLLDYIGRNIILMLSFAVSGVCLLTLGCFTFARNKLYVDITTLEFIPSACILIFTMIYKMGIGMVALLMSGELFPMNVKSIAAAFTELFSLGFNYVFIYLFNRITEIYGLHVIYFICSINCFLGILFTYFVAIETKGKSLHEIQLVLK